MRTVINKVLTIPIDIFGMFKSLWYFKGEPKRARIFKGYFHWQLAKRYARKRSNWWPPKFDQLGKRQGVFSYGDVSLIVISPKEIKLLKKHKVINSVKWHTKIFNKENLYKTAYNGKKITNVYEHVS